jgi:glutathione peroxidase
MANIFDFSAVSIDNKMISLKKYFGKVTLVVNTANRCGLTYHYKVLQRLYEKYRERGLIILGFLCNQFMNQEPENESNIKRFQLMTYPVPLSNKIEEIF